ncbi:MAG TPA: hypothetical protein VFX50_08205 [Gemmatimonadales bacterium]|nr:hypothetical protein [Gemmatimonadales bacterium]
MAALTAGGSVQLGGGARVSNRDARSGARLVHAGAHVSVDGSAELAGPEGTPVHTLVQEHDAMLGLATMSTSLLGATAEAWSHRAVVRRVAGSSPAERGAALLAAHAQGFRAFHVDGDVLLDVDHVGAPDQPVLVVSGHRLACTRPCRLHGLVYGDVAIRAAADLQNMTVQGAVVTRGHHVQAGGGVEYDAQTLERLRQLTGLLVKVPGSWRDF